jgi:hypothetical protein
MGSRDAKLRAATFPHLSRDSMALAEAADAAGLCRAPYHMVTEDEDLWSIVLSYLHLQAACQAALTCKDHHAWLQRRQMFYLSINNRGHPSPSEINIGERGTDSSGHPKLHFGGITQVRLGRLPSLVRITTLFPDLTMLRLFLSSGDLCGSPDRRKKSSIPFVDVVTAFDFLPSRFYKSPDQLPHGPLPLAVVSCTQLDQIEFSSSCTLHGSLTNAAIQASHRSREVKDSLAHLLLSMLVPCWDCLRLLDLTCLAPAVLSTLLQLELPSLEVLRIGGKAGEEQADESAWEWDEDIVRSVALKFPTLTGLDVGYALTVASFDDVETVCRMCHGLRHLDLSMVMEYADFGPGLHILAAHAPLLESLAIDALELPQEALVAFAAGCPRLSTLHLLECRVDEKVLLGFLRAARSLVSLDLSYGYAPADTLITWVRERDEEAAATEVAAEVAAAQVTAEPDVAVAASRSSSGRVEGGTSTGTVGGGGGGGGGAAAVVGVLRIREIVLQGSYTTRPVYKMDGEVVVPDEATAERERRELAKSLLDVAGHGTSRPLLRAITGGRFDLGGNVRKLVEQRTRLFNGLWREK